MRKTLREQLRRQLHAAKNPSHIGDLGVRWVTKSKCRGRGCTCEWVGISLQPPSPPETVRCPRCGHSEAPREVMRIRALVEVNAKAGVARYQRVDRHQPDADELPVGPWSYVPWDPATLPDAAGAYRVAARDGVEVSALVAGLERNPGSGAPSH